MHEREENNLNSGLTRLPQELTPSPRGKEGKSRGLQKRSVPERDSPRAADDKENRLRFLRKRVRRVASFTGIGREKTHNRAKRFPLHINGNPGSRRFPRFPQAMHVANSKPKSCQRAGMRVHWIQEERAIVIFTPRTDDSRGVGFSVALLLSSALSTVLDNPGPARATLATHIEGHERVRARPDSAKYVMDLGVQRGPGCLSSSSTGRTYFNHISHASCRVMAEGLGSFFPLTFNKIPIKFLERPSRQQLLLLRRLALLLSASASLSLSTHVSARATVAAHSEDPRDKANRTRARPDSAKYVHSPDGTRLHFRGTLVSLDHRLDNEFNQSERIKGMQVRQNMMQVRHRIWMAPSFSGRTYDRNFIYRQTTPGLLLRDRVPSGTSESNCCTFSKPFRVTTTIVRRVKAGSIVSGLELCNRTQPSTLSQPSTAQVVPWGWGYPLVAFT
ncbi:hypothetical protein DFH07DRAFT_938603 [Mycena maculata]|uniref:Uncharacterized protein n=1 Tax=Mycena maculata TaxID=230809 RepID=A0AAD7JNT5_9AGAR|nr:hypothetical protein DFH07DRAFT_938603 [Mycena maculata]